LVGVVEDREVARQAHAVAVGAQQAQGVAVEGAEEGLERPGGEQPLGAIAHLGRGLVGEGDGDDPGRVDAAFAHQPGDPVGDDAGLPGAGARHDELWPPLVGDRGELLGIELPFEVDRA